MNKILFFLLAVGSLMAMQSCSIHQQIHFNKNYSGTFKMEVDMSEALAFMSMMDTTGSMQGADMMMEIFKGIDSMDLREKYAGIDGISGVYLEPVDEGSFLLEYTFDGLEALNKSQQQMDELFSGMGKGMGDDSFSMNMDASSPDFEPFVLEKKTLTHRSEKTDQSPFGGMGGMEGAEGEEMLSGLGEMFNFQMDYSFDRKVRQVEAKGLVIEKQEKKFVSTKLDMEEMMKDGTYEISFKLR